MWRATAPGGVEKAVKVVFGHCDADLADRERKSLERVRSVRHPFLLTIERYEIVENRLIIVSELADSSLDQCFRQRRADGHPGLPRDQLLRFLADAAEALDCLGEQHGLQHLDIKPENLLLVGDHAKVADYGLVKQLASRTQQSMIGGMTPLYSAPEVFDGVPTQRSDQYSLAIVYQQMLTGTLPFSGQTVSQLVKQHTMAEPNLGPLSEADRVVVGRALSKDPNDRYANCKEFVRVLAGVSDQASAPAPSTAPPAPTSPDDTKSILAISTQQLRAPEEAANTRELSRVDSAPPTPQPLAPPTPSRAPLPKGPSEVVDLAPPDAAELAAARRPTLVIGLGGAGGKMLAAAQQAWSEWGDHAPDAAWLAIDTDREQLSELRRGPGHSLGDEDTIHTALRRPKDYRAADPALLRGVSRRWLYHIPRSLTTRGYRPLGRIALMDNAERVARAIAAKLRSLPTTEAAEPVRVVVVAGGCGGAGGGMLIDLAQAVRSVAEATSTPVSVEAIIGLPRQLRANDQLGAASLVSLLAELAHCQSKGNKGPGSADGWIARYERNDAPFDQVHLCPAPGPRETRGDALSIGLVATSAFALESLLAGQLGSGEDDLPGFRILGGVDCDRVAESLRASHTRAIHDEAVRQLRDVDPIASSSPAPPPSSAEPSEPREHAVSTAALRRTYQAFLSAFGEAPSPNGSEPPSELAQSTKNVVEGFVEACRAARAAGELGSPDRYSRMLDELIHTEVESTLSEAVVAESLLDAIEIDPLGCGYERSTIAICPRSAGSSARVEALRSLRPELGVVEADVPGTLLVCVGQGPTAPFLASRLESVFADVVDAGKRLHTRIDIDWDDLRG